MRGLYLWAAASITELKAGHCATAGIRATNLAGEGLIAEGAGSQNDRPFGTNERLLWIIVCAGNARLLNESIFTRQGVRDKISAQTFVDNRSEIPF